MLKQRDNIHSSFTVSRSIANLSGSGSGHFSNGSSSKVLGEDSPGEDGAQTPKTSHQRNDGSTLTLKDQIKRTKKLTIIYILYLIPSLRVLALLSNAKGAGIAIPKQVSSYILCSIC
ncbi:hypothetical protein AABB24_015696 [Solanum stoloniferum]|uniref:Uncharacterized protein n=1 Tax=Solanum stoloniferum TaxID=62892 RepID=A0ABD2TR22_9SOLN